MLGGKRLRVILAVLTHGLPKTDACLHELPLDVHPLVTLTTSCTAGSAIWSGETVRRFSNPVNHAHAVVRATKISTFGRRGANRCRPIMMRKATIARTTVGP